VIRHEVDDMVLSDRRGDGAAREAIAAQNNSISFSHSKDQHALKPMMTRLARSSVSY